MSLAKINGLFRLTRDAELINTQSGSVIAKFGLACSEKYKDKETQLFLDAVAFGKTGEIISQYAGSKGSQIYLSGKLQTETWQDNATGQNRSKVSMTIESFDFVSNGNKPQQQYTPPPTTYENVPKHTDYKPKQQPQQPQGLDVSYQDIPF